MRLRRKPWARPELAECSFFVDDPILNRNRWQQEFGNNNPMHLELGCGKGRFIARLGSENPNVNYIAVDLKSEVLGLAKRKAERLYSVSEFAPQDNLRLMSYDIERIDNMIGEQDKVERIYINFCNPWFKERHAKHRLTHTRQLLKYKTFLSMDGEIWFKTDDLPLFEDTLLYVQEAGYTVRYCTYDLHNSNFTENVTTEHEDMFAEQGIAIKFLIAAPKGI
ncbi:MAG: tRNA (guanosine(46)-N7)-methyltransferase TrmB [Angelakisella sp.]